MNIYIARNQSKVPVYLYDDERDTVFPLDPVSNRGEVAVEMTAPAEVHPVIRKYARKAVVPSPRKPKNGRKGGRGGQPGPRRCKLCEGYGHLAKTCPEKKPEAEKVKAGAEEGLVETADIRTQVQELKATGKTSVEIAAKLGISLKEVNKHW